MIIFLFLFSHSMSVHAELKSLTCLTASLEDSVLCLRGSSKVWSNGVVYLTNKYVLTHIIVCNIPKNRVVRVLESATDACV